MRLGYLRLGYLMGLTERHDRDEADREAETHDSDFVGVTVSATDGPDGWEASGWLGLALRGWRWIRAKQSA